jgi:3-phenylpropionate/trans-cinnamate dioxygenase ferredoxin reductase subunit
MKRVHIAIVGGGLAGATAADAYRAAGGSGSVLLLSSDPDLPVHRPPLSKGYLRGDESLDAVYVHAGDFYRDSGIDLRLETHVDRLDLAGKRVTTGDRETVEYEKLVLATGATPRVVALRAPISKESTRYAVSPIRTS